MYLCATIYGKDLQMRKVMLFVVKEDLMELWVVILPRVDSLGISKMHKGPMWAQLPPLYGTNVVQQVQEVE